MANRLCVSIFCLVFLGICNCYASNTNYQYVEVITKDQANYLTPENTLAARRSALLAGMLDWADETMTRESLGEEIRDYQLAGIAREKLFDLERNVKDVYITNKIMYNDAILLVVEAIGYDGSIQRVPFPFVKEDSLWKFTNKFSGDAVILEHLYYVPPLFDGKGQRPADVNSFLGYEQPSQVQTELAVGATSYTVHVYYGKSIDPATFTAKLNKQEISQKFTPKPFTDEEVVIPLQQGRNVLVLSVDGIKSDGRTATDSDRLVFIVP